MPPLPGGPIGPPGMGGPGGPELTLVGTDRTKEWLIEQIRFPQKHKPGSKMPPYGPDKISDSDLNHLASYLASLKGPAKKDGKEDPEKPKGK